MRIGLAALSPARRTTLMRSDAVQRLLAFAALIAIILIFSLLSPNFLQFDNVVGILIATAVNGILALGVTFVIISGSIDLSIGTVMTLSSVMTAVFITEWHAPVPVGILAGVSTGALAGIVNGTLVAKLKIPSFIATLGMLNVAKGLALVVSGLKPIYFNDTPEFNHAALGSVIGGVIPWVDIPNVVLVLFGCALVASLILTTTVLGRFTFALGSNEEAARLSGVNVVGWKIAVFTLAALLLGIARVLRHAPPSYAEPSL